MQIIKGCIWKVWVPLTLFYDTVSISNYIALIVE